MVCDAAATATELAQVALVGADSLVSKLKVDAMLGRGKKSVDHEIAQGWYPDAESPRIERFWNGQGWTDQTRPAAPVASEEPKSAFGRTQADKDKDRKFLKILAGGFGVIVVMSAIAQSSRPQAQGVPDALAIVEETPTTAAPATSTIPLTPLEMFDAELAEQSTVVETFYDEDLAFLRTEIHMDLLGINVEREVQLELRGILQLVAESELSVDDLDVAVRTWNAP